MRTECVGPNSQVKDHSLIPTIFSTPGFRAYRFAICSVVVMTAFRHGAFISFPSMSGVALGGEKWTEKVVDVKALKGNPTSGPDPRGGS